MSTRVRGLGILFSFFFILLVGQAVAQEEIYEFCGRHFFASYLDCSEEAINDNQGILRAMKAAIKASGANLVSMTDFEFSPAGYTMVALLSESHASIHTYPDRRACFVDLFTCGNTCSAEAFDAVLREYLAPEHVSERIFLRDESNRDDQPKTN